MKFSGISFSECEDPRFKVLKLLYSTWVQAAFAFSSEGFFKFFLPQLWHIYTHQEVCINVLRGSATIERAGIREV